MDHLFALDMQKDTLLTAFHSVALDETRQNIPVTVEKITEKQLYCIKESLGKRNLDETAFCQAYGVNHLEDLPKSVATDIVSEIKRKP